MRNRLTSKRGLHLGRQVIKRDCFNTVNYVSKGGTSMKLLIKDIKKNFENKEVLRGASFVFEKGKIYGLLGRNGAGKTTLFNCINEDIKIDGGSVQIEENGSLRAIGSNDIGYVLSTPVVPEFLTGREFLKFFLVVIFQKLYYMQYHHYLS